MKNRPLKRNVILLILALIIQTMIPLSVYADTSPDTVNASVLIDDTHQESGDRVIVEPDGNILVPISYSGAVNRYDDSGSFIETLPFGLNRAYALDTSLDGTVYDVGVFNNISVFDHDTNVLAYTIGTPNDEGGDFGAISSICVENASKIYSVGYNSGLWEIEVDVPAEPSGAIAPSIGTQLATAEDLGLTYEEDIQKGPDGSLYISGYTMNFDTWEADGKIVKVTLGEPIQIQTVYEANAELRKIEIRPDGSIYFIDNDNQLVKRLNVEGGIDVVAYGSLLCSPSDVAFADDGDLLISNFYGDEINSIVTKASDPAEGPAVDSPSDSVIEASGLQAGDVINVYTFDGEAFNLEDSVTATGETASIDNTFDGETVYISYTRSGEESSLREFTTPEVAPPETSGPTVFIDDSYQESGDRVIMEPGGTILVSDNYGYQVYRYDQDGSYLGYLDADDMWYPSAVDVGEDGKIYVADGYNYIRVFNSSLTGIDSIGIPNEEGDPGDFGVIGALCVDDENSKIYSVGYNSGLWEIDMDEGTGTRLATSEDLGLNDEEDIQIGPDGSLYISGFSRDDLAGRIVKVTPGSSVDIETVYETNCRLNRMEIKPDGSVYFADENQQVRRLNSDGTMDIAAYGSLLSEPTDVAFAPDGDLLIANYYGSDIGSIVTKAPDPAAGPSVEYLEDGTLEVSGLQADDEVNFYYYDGETFELFDSETAEDDSLIYDSHFPGEVYVSYTRSGAESGLREFIVPDEPDPGSDQPILSATAEDVNEGDSVTLSINRNSEDYVDTAVLAEFINGELEELYSIDDLDEEELAIEYTWDDMAGTLGDSDELDLVYRVYAEEPEDTPSIDDEDYLEQVQITFHATVEDEQPPEPPRPSRPNPPRPQPAAIDLNGEAVSAGTETTTFENGERVVSVDVNSDLVKSIIEEIANQSGNATENTLTVPISDTGTGSAKVNLTGDIVKELEQGSFDISIKRGSIEYVLPAADLTIDQVAKDLGVDAGALEKIGVEVRITNVDSNAAAKYEELIKENGSELILPPVQFEVTAKTTTADGKTENVSINKFNTYVERVMEIPANVDPSRVTTGIVFNADGTYEHVPTIVFQKDGKWYAKLNSLTNSDYSVIWNPVTVASVENHWSKEAVNDMASRLIIKNPETFDPKKNITRGEFAEYITKALGLYRTGIAADRLFTDVTNSNELADAVKTAVDYGIIKGYTDGSFKPNAAITREEAMVMYSRAMNIADLSGTDMSRIDHYTDYASVAGWAKENVKQVVAAKVFNGISDTKLAPKANLTTAEAATAIRNLLVQSELINEQK